MPLLNGQYKDLKLGEKGEKLFIKYINDNYDEKYTIKKTVRKYETYDFNIYENDELIGFWELKTRRVKYDTYSSIMVGYNKLKLMEKYQKKLNCRIYFLCYDKLMYWECKDVMGKQKDEWFIKKVYLSKRKISNTNVCIKREYLKEETDIICTKIIMSNFQNQTAIKTMDNIDLDFLPDSEDEC